MEGNAKVIAVTGKGGVGKTSLAAALVRSLTEKYKEAKILAIDADPAVGLATALDVEVKETLDDIRLEITEGVSEKLKETQDPLFLQHVCQILMPLSMSGSIRFKNLIKSYIRSGKYLTRLPLDIHSLLF